MAVTASSTHLCCLPFIQELTLSTARVIKPGIAERISDPTPLLDLSILEGASAGLISGKAEYKSSH